MWGESSDPLMVAAGFINFLATFDVNAVTLGVGLGLALTRGARLRVHSPRRDDRWSPSAADPSIRYQRVGSSARCGSVRRA
jgi:hypothetical protein